MTTMPPTATSDEIDWFGSRFAIRLERSILAARWMWDPFDEPVRPENFHAASTNGGKPLEQILCAQFDKSCRMGKLPSLD